MRSRADTLAEGQGVHPGQNRRFRAKRPFRNASAYEMHMKE